MHNVFDTRIFYKQAKSLVNEGYNVSLIAQHKHQEIVNKIKIIPLESPSNKLERLIKTDFQLLKKALKENAEVYHIHDPELILIGLFLKLKGKNVIYDIHENYSKNFLNKEWLGSTLLKKFTSSFFKYFEKTISYFFDYNVIVLDKWKDRYKNSVVVRNYPINEKEKVLPIDDREDKVVYIGNLSGKRGILEMLNGFSLASKKNPNISFDLIGEWGNKKIKKQALKIINSNNQINYLGYIPINEAKKIIKKAKVGLCLYTSDKYEENIPVKMYEYISYGVPVLCTDFESWEREIKSNDLGEVVSPFNTKKIANIILKMLTPSNFTKYYNHCISYRDNYSWKQEEKKLLKLYDNIT